MSVRFPVLQSFPFIPPLIFTPRHAVYPLHAFTNTSFCRAHPLHGQLLSVPYNITEMLPPGQGGGGLLLPSSMLPWLAAWTNHNAISTIFIPDECDFDCHPFCLRWIEAQMSFRVMHSSSAWCSVVDVALLRLMRNVYVVSRYVLFFYCGSAICSICIT
jgi:hypothetical protein